MELKPIAKFESQLNITTIFQSIPEKYTQDLLVIIPNQDYLVIAI
jgi:hypothetical protein